MQRRRSKSHTFEGRIAAERARVEQAAPKLPTGPQRDALLKKIDQLAPTSAVKRA
jgi:hypothetical protein